jgi:hypothetical protein
MRRRAHRRARELGDSRVRTTTPRTAPSSPRSSRSAVRPSSSSTPGVAAAASRTSGSSFSRRRLTASAAGSGGAWIQPQRLQARSGERTAPRASISLSSPSRSSVGTAEDWMKCVQTRLYACGSGCFSTSATRAPARPSMIAVAQPARLAPTMTASKSAGAAMIGRSWSLPGMSGLPSS